MRRRTLSRARDEARPKGHRFYAVTTQGPTWLTLAATAETLINTMNGPEKLPLVVLAGDAKRAGSAALFVPHACVKGEPNLRPLKSEPSASVAAALKRAGKQLGLKLDAKTTTVLRAALPNGAAFVVNQYIAPKGGYPTSNAFTMKADGTVVDVLLKGETPEHSLSFPYAVDLDGDGLDELVHIHDVWEAEDEVFLVGWANGKPRSVRIDSAVERLAP